ncbi:hypothetical protein FRC18_003860 [Serendipita sp. 400]|nr:hypothetical protein FRC18_003860 [Serendipita sp. 400]
MVCGQHKLSELKVSCVRYVWRGLLPAMFLLVLGALYLMPSLPSKFKLTRRFKRTFTPFLTLDDAQLLLKGSGVPNSTPASREAEARKKRLATLRLTLPISTLSLMEILTWTILFAYYLSIGQFLTAWISSLLVISWTYTFLRPLIYSTVTVPIDILALLCIHLVTGSLGFLGHAYDKYGYNRPWPNAWVITGEIIDLLVIIFLIVVNLNTPAETVPEGSVASPEDLATVWGWMTFGFINPLVAKGALGPLNEQDVPEVSPHHKASPLLQRFSKVKGKTLLRRIWVTNSLDLLMDGLLTLVSVIFNYSGPFFLKRILDAIEDPTPHAMARAYVYALLTLICSLLKNQTDMQHLWFGRQAVTRTRSILMAAVFDKAMKRKDFSGITTATKKGGGSGKISIKKAALESMGKGDKSKGGGSKPGAGADIGKIVNLMSGDASKVSQILGQVYNLYGAPFEIIVGTFFLYQLLGIAAFFGFVVLLSIAPLNNYLSKRRIFISKGIATARDRRMAVVNELFTYIKFIKLCAWDDRWIKRTEKAREKEIKWILRERFNLIMLAFLWTIAPILVSFFSFLAFVMQGNELTVSIAFTSIVLFNLLRQPLNVLPNFVAQLLQARVSLDRISAFFAEDEVDDMISTLKMKEGLLDGTPKDATLGIIGNANFMWNSIEPRKSEAPVQSNAGDLRDIQVTTANGSSHRPGDESPTDSVPSTDDAKFELRDINIIFPEGELSLVTGATASGKTALLMAQLGEMTMSAPSEVTINPRILLPKFPHAPPDEYGLRPCVSYAAQTPWLEHLSLRDNILFGEPFDSNRYWEVIESCALRTDLEILEDGDFTEIGERGISLSGGQKARVALARAVYARSKVVLLDDPLSAVDSHTARFLYERLFCGPLLKNRTVVLVTHHVELVLPAAYYYVQMQDGRIEVQGTVSELRREGVLDDLQVELVQDQSTGLPMDDEEAEIGAGTQKAVVLADCSWIASQQEADKTRKKPRKLIEEESRRSGGVQWMVYDTYLRASGYHIWCAVLLLIGVTQLFGFLDKYWIKVWGEAYDDTDTSLRAISQTILATFRELGKLDSGTSDNQISTPYYLHVNPHLPQIDTKTLPSANQHPLFYVVIYGAIGVGGVILTSLNTVVQYSGAIRASRALFRRLLNSLVHATFRFHDTTPTGRILNRLSRDMEVVDSSVSDSLRAVLFRVSTFIASMVIVAYIFPLFLIPATIISYLYVQISKGYINAGRDMRRMQSTTRSPIFAAFAESLEGIVTVRAFGAERRFLAILMQRIDLTTKMWYGWFMMNRWLLLRFDALGDFSIFIITIFALSGYISSGWAGITITTAMQFKVAVYWTCRLATQLELDLNSVERVVEYLDLPQEAPTVIEGKSVPAYWPSTHETGVNDSPSHGGSATSKDFIHVENLVIRYAPELQPVLHGVSFTLRAGEKIGLLGRTGSGKSTLAMSLLRFVEPSGGTIFIDGIDITSIGLKDLRSRVTIIPQDSVLFSGTLRENLDPFEEHTDSECLDALYRVHLLTPGARVRPPTITVGSGSQSPGHSAGSILNRPMTPEPESMHHDDGPESSKSGFIRADTFLAPAQRNNVGSNTPSSVGASSNDEYLPRHMSTDAEIHGYRYGMGNESGVVSPTGALSPVGRPSGMVHFADSVRFAPIPETPLRKDDSSRSLDPDISATFAAAGISRRRYNTRGPGESGAISRSGTMSEGPVLTLDTQVASGGANFSNGQRQLISMARALLRRNSIVILDEATSSIDFETDAKIQATVREEFNSSCLLTIAHRIRTVVDYDRLIVLDKGRIQEFDTPWNLIQKEGGIFRDMCIKSGQMRELETLAKAKAQEGARGIINLNV